MTKRKRPPLVERLTQALEAGIAAERGERILRSRALVLPEPPPLFDAERILRIRRRRNLTQSGLAMLLNVSDKTVESWEQGRRKPSGAAARFLQLLEAPEAFGRWFGDRPEGTGSLLDGSRESEVGRPAP